MSAHLSDKDQKKQCVIPLYKCTQFRQRTQKHNVWYHYISALSSDREHKNTMELELVNISPLIVYELELNFSS